MKYVYTLLAALALFAGCGAVPTHLSTSRDIAMMIDKEQRGVELAMSLFGSAGNLSKYEVAENRVENGISSTDIALIDEVS
jgi:hypothetical protein